MLATWDSIFSVDTLENHTEAGYLECYVDGLSHIYIYIYKIGAMYLSVLSWLILRLSEKI